MTIGRNVLLGPRVGIYTAAHPLDAGTRATGAEFEAPIEIGDDVWIGGNAVPRAAAARERRLSSRAFRFSLFAFPRRVRENLRL